MAKAAVFCLTLALCALVLANPWGSEIREDAWWMDRHNSFVRNSQENAANINVIFYGDSITEAWGGPGRDVFNQFYEPLGTANYGIGGDQTQHLNWRIYNGEVDGLTPKLTVLKIGTNNFGFQDNDIAAGTLSVVTALRFRLPNTKILLLGILPRNDAYNNRRVRSINEQISTADNGNTIRYLDMFEVFCKGEDQFERHLYDQDLLHLSTAGYVAWADAMNPLLNEMLQS